MMQLAMALEGCGKNFIWVVMSPLGFDINFEFKASEWLPEGFEERIEESGRGLSVDLSIPPSRKLHTNSSFFLQQLHIVKQLYKNINLRKCGEIKEIINTAIKDESNSKGSSTKAVDQFLDALKTKRRSNNDI
ncbi:hypothetical protein Pint_31213 [Pistacia integerrima]|uniref:Uncharacterized protein n=2 Tax=Pistacia integerrima TaxID=434235 RepID=A0ACC0XQJ6_9ROSI|nr:hypothetical protein Pint_31204 [Pistacia integerrima]KAJ0021729.1 hypothetical protein Pint_31213 [Pistacia integerrima]